MSAYRDQSQGHGFVYVDIEQLLAQRDVLKAQEAGAQKREQEILSRPVEKNAEEEAIGLIRKNLDGISKQMQKPKRQK